MATIRTFGEQTTLDGGTVPVTRLVWAPGEFARLRTLAREQYCDTCPKRLRGRAVARAAYPVYAPFAAEPDTQYACPECRDRGYDTEGHTYCDGCSRDVHYDDNLTDGGGWRVDPQWPKDGSICARCYQDSVLEHGHTSGQLDHGPDDASGITYDDWTDTQLADHGWDKFDTVEAIPPGTPAGRLAVWRIVRLLVRFAEAHNTCILIRPTRHTAHASSYDVFTKVPH